jgi:hypothetical protein
MEANNFIFVVGDKFKDFGKHDPVYTLSSLLDALAQNDTAALAGKTVVPGQGLSTADIGRVVDAAPAGLLDVSLLQSSPVPAGSRATHKHRLYNALISTPVQIGPDQYQSALLVDERSELMTDHQSGQHVQGMVLIEAARQMLLAVTETFFINEEEGREYAFVFNQIDVKYLAFVFPLGCTLRYQITEKSVDNPDRLSFLVKIAIEQTGQVATEVEAKFTAFQADRIYRKENEQAIKVLGKQADWLAGADQRLALVN